LMKLICNIFFMTSPFYVKNKDQIKI